MGIPRDGSTVVELDEEDVAELVGSMDYRFFQIGAPVPVMTDETAVFDAKSVPHRPVTLSLRFRLLFVAHVKGFCVTRTSDVMSAAENIIDEGTRRPVQEFCLVDVPLENISLISLSSDEALLAACVANTIHFFAVSALLHKEQKPSFSVSLSDSNSIKDMIWAKKVAKAFVVLSDDGELYHGSCQGPITLVMNGVDCVDWSSQENYIVVVKKNIVIVLSPQFEEKCLFSLHFKSIVDDSDATQVIKVDSIRWIRPDCIAVGCSNLSDNGEEVNYFVQFITSRGASIKDSNESSKPVVISFKDVDLNNCPNVPDMNGSHLLLSYLDHHGLAFISIRNLSRQVGLTCWSPENGNNRAAVVEILNDSWNLYIDCEANEENVIVGLAVDKLSQNENARCIVGVKETEVSPCCVIVCLTIDGSISVFHFASYAGVLPSQEVYGYEAEDDNSCVSTKSELPHISSSGGEQKREITSSTSENAQRDVTEHARTDSKASTRNDFLPSQSDGNRLPPSTHPDSRDLLDRYAASTKPIQREFTKEIPASSFPSRRPYSAVNTPRHLGNVEEMIRELDNLLEDIEEKGGFTDSSIPDSVKALEDDLWALSDRCRISRGIMDDKLREAKLLLDKTLEVMTRKVNIEVALRRAMDSRYWELWDDQKLSYEMESKMKSIMQGEQALTKQLIELERHFNALELNKFGEDRGVRRNKMVLQNSSSNSRNSLQSLCNTLHAQLEAAEQLSVRLSEQMASLGIESSGKHDMKRQLFESVGLHYSGGDLSPAANRTSNTPSTIERKMTSLSLATRERTKKDQASVVANIEPKTARRQRYSLDQSWAMVDPPRTTVKRMTKQDIEKGSSRGVVLSSNKPYLGTDLQKKSEFHSARNASEESLNRYRNKGITGSPEKQFRESSFRSSGQIALPGFGIEASSSGNLPAPRQNVVQIRGVRSGETLVHSVDQTSNISLSFNEASSSGNLPAPQQTIVPSRGVRNGEEPLHSVDQTSIVQSRGVRNGEAPLHSVDQTSNFSLPFNVKIQSSVMTVTNSFSTMNHTDSGSGISVSENKDSAMHHGKRSSTIKLSSDLPVLSRVNNLSPESSSSGALFPGIPSLSQPSDLTIDAKREVSSLVEIPVTLIPSETISNSTRVSAPKEVIPVAESNLKFETPVSSAPSLWLSSSGREGPDLGLSLITPAPVSEPPPTSTASAVASSGGGFVGIVENVASDQSEEMEEEVPETSGAADISLGSLGSFGIGSQSNATPRNTKNPFGVSVTSTSSAFPTFPVYNIPSAGGELFRPASFSFPSPQPLESVQSAPALNISGGFNASIPGHSPGAAGFGHPSTIGAGQQAIGSVLGAFGQSRQLGTGLPGSGFAAGGGFGGSVSGGAAASGGYSGLASGFGGFAGAASGGHGFAGAATASNVSGGGFGAFSNQKVGVGFSAFGGSSVAGRPPSELFTQMRK